MLEARGVTSGYNGVAVLHDFNLTLHSGEVVTLLGPNGAGKTTALLTLVGLLPSMAGSIGALGAKVGARRTARLARAGVLLVPDDRGIFAELTVAEHFRIVGKVPKARIEMVLARFPALRRLMHRRAGLLSGGEQQMLAIGKALLADPKVLMVDEMSLGLAPTVVQQMLPGIRDLAREEGIAVLLVEQHVAIALSVSDRAIVLNQGRTVLAGDAAALAENGARIEAAYFGTPA
ncbi:ABC transporter ATP-binding protein [Dactylosporangium sp. CA-092794]|uniref:ABC transporter ATP-binding protein n=1 Tax=Dactylosporangium sp. CA-092794 TaxID=3239929 RepID=UPI003D936564